MEENRVTAVYPRDVLKEAFQFELIADGETWMDMLEKRNLMTHTYDEKLSTLAFSLIHDRYLIALKQVYETLKRKI